LSNSTIRLLVDEPAVPASEVCGDVDKRLPLLRGAVGGRAIDVKFVRCSIDWKSGSIEQAPL
jgi:hypothetical protein